MNIEQHESKINELLDEYKTKYLELTKRMFSSGAISEEENIHRVFHAMLLLTAEEMQYFRGDGYEEMVENLRQI
jgi:DNA-binding ferritin-like protein (Dps family)